MFGLLEQLHMFYDNINYNNKGNIPYLPYETININLEHKENKVKDTFVRDYNLTLNMNNDNATTIYNMSPLHNDNESINVERTKYNDCSVIKQNNIDNTDNK